MYSTSEVIAWLIGAPEGNINCSIVVDTTHDVPRDMAAFIMALDEANYIRAMWKRTIGNDNRPIWTWHLLRCERSARRDRLTSLSDRLSMFNMGLPA